MSKPHACPVCNGYGTVSKPPNIAGDQETWSGTNANSYQCPACHGTGIIWEFAAVNVPSCWPANTADSDRCSSVTYTAAPSPYNNLRPAPGRYFNKYVCVKPIPVNDPVCEGPDCEGCQWLRKLEKEEARGFTDDEKELWVWLYTQHESTELKFWPDDKKQILFELDRKIMGHRNSGRHENI
jgi:hypothetical protein